MNYITWEHKEELFQEDEVCATFYFLYVIRTGFFFFLFQHGENDPQAVASWSLHSQINVTAAPGCERSGNGQGK